MHAAAGLQVVGCAAAALRCCRFASVVFVFHFHCKIGEREEEEEEIKEEKTKDLSVSVSQSCMQQTQQHYQQ